MMSRSISRTTGGYKVVFVSSEPDHACKLYNAGYAAGVAAVGDRLNFLRAMRKLQQKASKGVKWLKLNTDDDVFQYMQDPEKWKSDHGIQEVGHE